MLARSLAISKKFVTSGISYKTYTKMVEEAALNNTSNLNVSTTRSFNDFFAV